jgi:hypothetical protein
MQRKKGKSKGRSFCPVDKGYCFYSYFLCSLFILIFFLIRIRGCILIYLQLRTLALLLTSLCFSSTGPEVQWTKGSEVRGQKEIKNRRIKIRK